MARFYFGRLDFGIKIFAFYFACVSCVTLFSDEEETHAEGFFGSRPIPWFTGPLLATSANTVAPKHFKVQPYFNSFVRIGHYDKHWHATSVPNFYDVNVRLQMKVGVTKWLDVQFLPRFEYRETQGKHSCNIGDLPIGLNIQILRPKYLGDGPSLKLGLRANVPSGKYQHLKASKLHTDLTGSGCWFPGSGLYLSNLWYLGGIHYAELRISTEYRVGVPVRLRGLNAYGGTSKTDATGYPGNYFRLDAAIEYNFTRNWAFACDALFRHFNRNRFTGKNTKDLDTHSREEFSLAPAIEYNWSKNLGIIGGVWFSIAGRNSHQFVNGMLSLDAYF